MKTAVKVLLILVSFAVLHEALRFACTDAANAYEMNHPCGCGVPSFWLVWAIRFADFFFEWPTGNYYLSDFIWGTAATALYLWIGKRRKLRRLMQQANINVQAGVWPPAPKML